MAPKGKFQRGKRMQKGRKPQRKRGEWTAEVKAKDERVKQRNEAREAKRAAEEAELQAKIDPTDPIWKQLAIERIKVDPAWWIRRFVYTSDSHDDNERVKKFPMDKGYFDFIIDILLEDKIVFAAKSSKILASWLGSSLCVWKALFFQHSECYVQCLNESAVDYFIQRRMKAIYDNLPDWQKQPGTSFRFCYMNIPAMDSFVEGIPKGADKIRGRSPSLFIMDEVAFIDDANKAVNAALPRILGDAMFLGISTPNMRNFFYRRTHPHNRKLLEEFRPIPESPKTVVYRHEGQTELFIHYTVDPAKRSLEWVKKEKEKLLEEEGKGEEAWEQEMELSFDVTGEPRLYPSYDPAIHEAEVKYNPVWPVIRGMDFGCAYPAAAYMQYDRKLDQIILLWAMLLEDCDIDEFAGLILDHCEENYPPLNDKGVIYPTKYKDYCDHSGTQQHWLGNTVKILRRRHGIRPKSQFSRPEERAKLIRTRLRVNERGVPGIIVNKNCHLLAEGFRSGFTSKPDKQGKPTGIPFKDGHYEHVHDAIGYPLDCLFSVPKNQKLVLNRKKLARKRSAELHRRYQNTVTGYSYA